MKNNWRFKSVNNQFVEKIQKLSNLSFISSTFLSQKLNDSESLEEDIKKYLNVNLKNNWIDPISIKNMEKATELLKKHIENSSKIGILADYDVDGISSCIILESMLKKLNLETCIFIPNRSDGYGPNQNAINYFKNENVSLIFLLDCGTTSFEFIEKAQTDIIVIDHHFSTNYVNLETLINPTLSDSTQELKELCAATLTFLFCHSFLKNSNYDINFINEFLNKNLDLVAIATICDVMKLNNLNKAFIKLGLKKIEENNRIGIKHLLNLSKIKLPITANDIAFYIGPKINASGRIEEAKTAYKLLVSKDEEESAELAIKLEKINNLRKNLQQEAYLEAKQLAENKKNNQIICIASKNFHIGIMGIIAAMIQEEFQKPTIVGSILDDNIIKASARSNTFNIGSLIHQAQTNNLILTGGGHAAAAGFSILSENFDEFDRWANEFELKIEEKFIEICMKTDLNSVKNDFYKLGPFGNGNEAIKICIENLIVRDFFENEKSYKIILEEDFKNHTFFLPKKREKLANFIKNAMEARKTIDIILELNEKNFHSIIDSKFHY